jgi:hypothetical protein
VFSSACITLSRNETHQNFSVWVDGNDKLARGSGPVVGETGVEANQHFLDPRDGTHFRFTEGRYWLDVPTEPENGCFSRLARPRTTVRIAPTSPVNRAASDKFPSGSVGV